MHNSLDNFTIEFKCAETDGKDMYEDCGTVISKKPIEYQLLMSPRGVALKQTSFG